MKKILATSLTVLGIAFWGAVGVTAVTAVVSTPKAEASGCFKFPGTICTGYTGCSRSTSYFYSHGFYLRFVRREGTYYRYAVKSAYSGLSYVQYNNC